MKALVYIPNFGCTAYEIDSIESELAALKAKYPQHADAITVRAWTEPKRLSDTEREALESDL